jgi:hypothetical protein
MSFSVTIHPRDNEEGDDSPFITVTQVHLNIAGRKMLVFDPKCLDCTDQPLRGLIVFRFGAVQLRAGGLHSERDDRLIRDYIHDGFATR